MRDFYKLKIWEDSHKLTLDVYNITKSFPKDELFGLTSQLRRAMTSIPTNIAEGCGRPTPADFARFLQISVGSSTEAEYELLLARDLNYINEVVFNDLRNRIVENRKMIVSYIKKVLEQG